MYTHTILCIHVCIHMRDVAALYTLYPWVLLKYKTHTTNIAHTPYVPPPPQDVLVHAAAASLQGLDEGQWKETGTLLPGPATEEGGRYGQLYDTMFGRIRGMFQVGGWCVLLMCVLCLVNVFVCCEHVNGPYIHTRRHICDCTCVYVCICLATLMYITCIPLLTSHLPQLLLTDAPPHTNVANDFVSVLGRWLIWLIWTANQQQSQQQQPSTSASTKPSTPTADTTNTQPTRPASRGSPLEAGGARPPRPKTPPGQPDVATLVFTTMLTAVEWVDSCPGHRQGAYMELGYLLLTMLTMRPGVGSGGGGQRGQGVGAAAGAPRRTRTSRDSWGSMRSGGSGGGGNKSDGML